MAERIRNTKKLSQRIDRGYFKKTFFIPKWKWLGSAILAAVGLLWLGWDATAGGKQAYNAGPLSHPHSMLTSNCAACHKTDALWGKKVSDQACLTCHDAPAHQAKQTFTPECSACHVEHRGSQTLNATNETTCTQCHASLKVTDGTVKFAANVKSFVDGSHPEFAAVKQGHAPDKADVKFNHQVHMKSDLRGPKGPVQLECAGCHAPAPNAKGVPAKDSPMAPVNFEKHCAECHPLQFDPDDPDVAPHKTPAEIQSFVMTSLTNYIAKNPDKLRAPLRMDPKLPQRPLPAPPANGAQWVAQRMEEANRLLFQKACKECHSQSTPANAKLPEIAATNIPVTWMSNAKFDHTTHQLAACTECHVSASKSKDTADVNLPSIATCQKCHTGAANAAESRCSECHAYHDWSKAKPVKGSLISQLK